MEFVVLKVDLLNAIEQKDWQQILLSERFVKK